MDNRQANPKITVIIPTRERHEVLDRALKTVTTQDYDNLEIIVSDNFSADATKDIVSDVGDPRIKYINTGKRISMAENWEFALSHVSDGWITIIGDDDGLLPGSIKSVSEIIETADCQAIRSDICTYVWPNSENNQKAYGRLVVPLRSRCEVRDSRRFLSKVLLGRCSHTELPMLYNGGFVSMAVIAAIKRKSGSFYKSCIPDVYSAMAISSTIANYVYSYRPFALNGASRHSTGSSHFSSKTSSVPLKADDQLSPGRKFYLEGNLPFHEDIPLTPDGEIPKSIQVSVYETYLQSAFLRLEEHKTSHAEQLEIMIASSGVHKKEVEEWAPLFARKHRLDFDRIRRDATIKEKLDVLRSFPERLTRAINIYSFDGTWSLPIKDVYEASVAAATVQTLQPNRLRSVSQLLGRLATRALK